MRFWMTSLAIFAAFLGIATAASYQAINNICVTQECNDTALRIKDSMDLGVNPCDDFYEFTCGGYIKNTTIPEEDQKVEVFSSFNKPYQLQLKSLFEAEITKDDIRPFKLAKILYKSCMDEDAINAAGLLPLKQLLKDIGGWPVLEGDSWNEKNFDWIGSIAKWKRAGLIVDWFIKIAIKHDPENNSRKVLDVRPPSWPESRFLDKGFNATEEIRAYYKLMVDIAVSLGAEEKRAEDELKEALLFHIELSKVTGSNKSGLNRMTVKELIELYPRVDWRDTFERIYSPTQKIDDDELVLVHSPEFIDQAIDLILKTSPRVLANFAIFQTIPILAVNQEMQDKFRVYLDAMQGATEKRSPRWVTCIDTMKFDMPLSVVAMYAKKFLRPEIKEQIEDLIREIRRQFQTNIDKVSFLDAVTKVTVRKKEEAIKTVIGAPNGLLDNDNLDDYYQDLELFESKYFLNHLHMLQFRYNQSVRHFREPINIINSTRVIRNLMDINAYAEMDLNTIFLSTSILQGPFFHPERPRYINFATIGLAIAHQMTNFFDTKGSLYDENGNKKDWWTPATKKAFDEQVQCFVDQYGSYTEETLKLKVDGQKTVNVNIAENGGAKLAYHAYVNSMRGKTPEKTLPGLDYTQNQMYWIAYGNLWCKKYRPAYLKYEWTWSAHTYARFRVIGTVSNSEDFAKVFKCPPGSKMNPVKKCSLW